MKIIEITRGESKVLDEIQTGAKIIISNEKDGQRFELIHASAKHRGDVIEGAYRAAEGAGMLKEVDRGLFEGFGQSFAIVR